MFMPPFELAAEAVPEAAMGATTVKASISTTKADDTFQNPTTKEDNWSPLFNHRLFLLDI